MMYFDCDATVFEPGACGCVFDAGDAGECFEKGVAVPFVLYLHTSAMSANAAMASQAEAAAQASGESGVCGIGKAVLAATSSGDW